jgi:hypothetical protein
MCITNHTLLLAIILFLSSKGDKKNEDQTINLLFSTIRELEEEKL